MPRQGDGRRFAMDAAAVILNDKGGGMRTFRTAPREGTLPKMGLPLPAPRVRVPVRVDAQARMRTSETLAGVESAGDDSGDRLHPDIVAALYPEVRDQARLGTDSTVSADGAFPMMQSPRVTEAEKLTVTKTPDNLNRTGSRGGPQSEQTAPAAASEFIQERIQSPNRPESKDSSGNPRPLRR